MCYLYFFIYSALAVLRALGRQQYDNLIELFKICAFCVNLAPMMCVLFIGEFIFGLLSGRDTFRMYSNYVKSQFFT